MFTLGLDYGANSVRCSDGAEYGSRVVDYPSGTQGVLLDSRDGRLARQNPDDYLFGLEETVRGALAAASTKPDFSAAKIVGIGVDTTGSSPPPCALPRALRQLRRPDRAADLTRVMKDLIEIKYAQRAAA